MNELSPLPVPVRRIISDVLGCDLEEVADDQHFFDDLGGESMDLLDLSFRIEKELGIRINFQQMLASPGWEFDDQGRLTAATVRKLQDEFPGIDVERFGVVEGTSFGSLLTVGFIIALVVSRSAVSSRAAG